MPNAATEAQVRELLQLTDAPTRVHRDLAEGVASMKAKAPPYVPATVWTEMDADFRALDIVQIYLPVYQAYLTQPEMASLLTFYRTDAGKHYATVQGQLLAGTQAVLGQRVQSVLQATAAKHRDEIEAARKKAEEPATPAPGSAPAPGSTPAPAPQSPK